MRVRARRRDVHRETPTTEARGLIEVSTFKGGERCPAPSATLFIYLRHIQLRPRDRKTDCADGRARDSRRYLHANSSETRFHARKNPDHDESRVCEGEAPRGGQSSSVSRDVLVSSHLRPPRFFVTFATSKFFSRVVLYTLESRPFALLTPNSS